MDKRNTESLFGSFLAGIPVLLVYFNIWSLWLPTNYFALLIPLSVALIGLLKTSLRQEIRISSANIFSDLLQGQQGIVTICFLVVLLAFSFVVPYNEDSAGYHYLSILWSEKYKVVPGLANLSAKYGTHSSFFVLCAAYSFTDVLKQSIYPANFIIVPLFYLWALNKSYKYTDGRRYFLWFILLVLFRYLLINIASPSPDALAAVLLFFILFSFYEQTWESKTRLIVLLCFAAVILKLSTIPVLLVIPYMIWMNRKKETFLSSVKFSFIAGALLLLPWLIRGVIISGYPLFPSTYLNIFNVDWKVPEHIALAEKDHITILTRMLGTDINAIKQLSIFEWLPLWYKEVWRANLVNAFLVAFAFLSPLYWLFVGLKKANRTEIMIYLVSYAGVWFWVTQSSDIRFGIVFKLFCMFIPLSYLLQRLIVTKRSEVIMLSIVILSAIYYTAMGFKKTPVHFISNNLFLPPKDDFYYKDNDLSTFRYIMLNSNVKLYIYDSAHHSINAPLPVYSAPQRPGVDTTINIEMRGNRIEEGFRHKNILNRTE